MKNKITSKVSCGINAPVSKVWEVLTTPQMTKKFLFGAEANSDWKAGSPVIFKGNWEGQPYENKGTVLSSKRNHSLRFSVPSSQNSSGDDIQITYELKESGNETTLTVIQENLPDETVKENSEYNWNVALTYLKNMVEEQMVKSSRA